MGECTSASQVFSFQVLSFQVKDDPNVKFLWYEDMKKDLGKVIEDLCGFLEHPLKPSQVESLVEHLQFDNMKKNVNIYPVAGPMKDGGGFLRKGAVGDWKNFFAPEMVEDWAEWINRKTEGTELREKISPY